jgi:diguanylate cyclase (GGDEF)-like protein/PAS domain S-box-containing protein
MNWPRPKRGNVQTPLAVLIVEDSESDAQLILRLLKKAGYEVVAERVETVEQMRAALEKQHDWDIVISDYSMPQFSGPAALDLIKEKQPHIPFIVVSGTIGEENAVAMMKAGAHDYLIKGNLARLAPAVKRELEQAKMRQERVLAEQALRSSEEKYRTLVEQASDTIFLTGPDGQFLDINAAGCKLSGYSRDEVLQLKIQDVTRGLETAPLRFEELRNGKVVISEREIIRKDGVSIWVEISVKQLPDGNLQGIARDITQRKGAEERLRQLSSAVEHSPSAILITDAHGNIEYVNSKFTMLNGYTLDEVRGTTLRILKSDEMPAEIYAELWQTILSGKEWRGEFLNKRKNGELYWEYASISAILDSSGRISHFVSVNEDITARKEAEEKIRRLNAGLEQLAITDYLTNLYNRRYFMQRGAEEFKLARRTNQPLSLLMMDIDHFKTVNDSHGHEAGDMALQQVAAMLKSSLRETDILGRMGGEEFAVLLPGTSLNEAGLLAERIRQLVGNTSFEIPCKSLIVTISIGVVMLTGETSGIDDMLRNADLAMYKAKRHGGNCVVRYEDISNSDRSLSALTGK